MKKLLLVVALVLSIFCFVSCDFEPEEKTLVCKSNIVGINAKGIGGDVGEKVIGIRFVENVGNGQYEKIAKDPITMDCLEDGNIFYLYYLNETKRSGYGINFNYILFVPSCIHKVFQEVTGRTDFASSFWWYVSEYLKGKPNSSETWTPILAKLLNNNKLPYPKTKDIDSSLISEYPRMEEIIPLGDNWYDSEEAAYEDAKKQSGFDVTKYKRDAFNISDGILRPNIYILEVYSNYLGNINYGYAKAVVWYLNTYHSDLFPTKDSVYSAFLNNREAFFDTIRGLKFTMADADPYKPKGSDVPKEIEIYSAAEFIEIPEIKELKKTNQIALQQITNIGITWYSPEQLPDRYGDSDKDMFYYTYSLNCAGCVDNVCIYYPASANMGFNSKIVGSKLTKIYKDCGATPIDSTATKFGWAEYFIPENVEKVKNYHIPDTSSWFTN